MKKISLILILILAFGALLYSADQTAAQTKVIKKTIKKVVIPNIAPVEPPKVEEEAKDELPPPPPPAPLQEETVPKEEKGIFGWGINSDLGGLLTFNPMLLGLRGSVVFDDPLYIGEKIGLPYDAVEYSAGAGLAFGSDSKSQSIAALPLFADVKVYLKENSLFGMDPYLGVGLTYNLLGFNNNAGGFGLKYYLGILADFGIAGQKTGLALGSHTYNVEGRGVASGLTFFLSQPVKL